LLVKTRGSAVRSIMRHKVLFVLGALLAILLTLVVGSATYLNQQLSSIPRVELHLPEAGRPGPATGASADAENILLAGADAGDGPSIAEAVTEGTWQPGSHRSDTIMVLHITADRDAAYLISVPRDAWVEIPGYGMHKLNAAFSYGGPELYVRTMELLTGMRMDHLAIVDWDGFKDLTNALGGVQVYVPPSSAAESPVLEPGRQTLDGEEALRYVRERKSLPGGEFDRIARQQNVLRSIIHKLVSRGTLTNPARLTDVLGAITDNLVLDQDFTNSTIRDLALSLRGVRADDVTFVTAPVKGTDWIAGQSVVLLDREATGKLFGAVLADELDQYLAHHDAAVLAEPRSVS
jgi:LCP family protein required for cell wall assembly